MFEAAELGHRIPKGEFNAAIPELRAQILEAQYDLRTTQSPLIVIVSGVQGAGKGAVVNRLNEWMDTRYIENDAFWEASDEEKERPAYWRYWRAMPPRGLTGIFFGGWYSGELFDRGYAADDLGVIDRELTRIVDLERMLSLDGALILKFWYHLPRKTQKQRLADSSEDERSYWRMASQYAGSKKEFAKFTALGERIIRATDTGLAPWHIIEATDHRYRDLSTARIILGEMQRHLARAVDARPADDRRDEAQGAGVVVDTDKVSVLDKVDVSRTLPKDAYKKRLGALQKELNELAWEAYRVKRATVLVFEGWDAAGKGGAIRRVSGAIDARIAGAIAIAAPTDEERAHHYLWRFWRHVPRAGHLLIFDRSWYGRVLVERVEGFASTQEWQRSYREINDFEHQMVEKGTLLLKFWIHIDKDEQLRRFKEREQVAYKRHKITDEDWRNREKWDDYERAINEMVVRTSTGYAPWTLVAGNDKRYARVEVLNTLCGRLRHALEKA